MEAFFKQPKCLLENSQLFMTVLYGCSVTQSCLILWPNGLQHARLPWPSPSPGVSSNSCPLSCWCHPTVSSSVIPFFSCLQFFPASESSPVSWLFALGGQRIETSALASVLPINSQSSFPLGLNGLLAVQGTVKSLLQHHSQKASILQHSLFFNCLVVTSIHQFSSVAQSSPTLWDPMDCSIPGLPVHHQLVEFTQTHAHWVSDAFQPSHPLPSPSPPACNLSQHQGHFQWVSSSHQVAKVLEFQLQHQSFQWIFRTDLL